MLQNEIDDIVAVYEAIRLAEIRGNDDAELLSKIGRKAFMILQIEKLKKNIVARNLLLSR